MKSVLAATYKIKGKKLQCCLQARFVC